MRPRRFDISSADDIPAFDRDHLWHPYAALPSLPAPLVVESAQGSRIRLADGRELVDGVSSWWTAIHGYRHPTLIEAARGQMEVLAHVMFGGLTHKPAAELGALLLGILPEPLEAIFYCDSGSVAVEVAIKMAIQYWEARGMPERKRLITVRGGYHGDTFMAMSVCDPIDGMHARFRGAIPAQIFADAPRCRFGGAWDEADISSFESLAARHSDTIAAAILEPIVQAAGGMRFYHPRYLERVREICDRNNILLILDEVATGFGRTGKLFACEHASVVPDIICVGKALTGGFIGLAAVIATREVADAISSAKDTPFMHGPTFMANPLACAVAAASVRLLLESPWQERVRRIEEILRTGLSPCASMPGVREVRVLGDIGVVECERRVDRAKAIPFFAERGAWIRPFDNIIYLMPPYIIDEEDMNLLIDAVTAALREGAW